MLGRYTTGLCAIRDTRSERLFLDGFGVKNIKTSFSGAKAGI